jgi:hypothetical protein
VLWLRLLCNWALYRLDSSIIRTFRSRCVKGLSQRLTTGYRSHFVRSPGMRVGCIVTCGPCGPSHQLLVSANACRHHRASGIGANRWYPLAMAKLSGPRRRRTRPLPRGPVSGEERLHRIGAARHQRERCAEPPAGERVQGRSRPSRHCKGCHRPRLGLKLYGCPVGRGREQPATRINVCRPDPDDRLAAAGGEVSRG